MEPLDLLLHAAEALTEMQVPYLVTGSMATITYGEARFTNDVDIVADLRSQHVATLLGFFPAPEFYVSESAVKDAIERRYQFNVIHPASGLKIDFMVPTDDPFNESRLARGVSIRLDEQGRTAMFASAEDAILKKLQYYREGESQKHLRDIRGVLLVQGEAIDQTYLKKWADVLGVSQQLDEILSQ
jgi:hypothetical protein